MSKELIGGILFIITLAILAILRQVKMQRAIEKRMEELLNDATN